MCMPTHIYLYSHIYICIDITIPAYICIYMCMYMDVYVHLRISTHTCTVQTDIYRFIFKAFRGSFFFLSGFFYSTAEI